MHPTDKRYYKIGDVAEMLGLPQSTLRFWETQFPTAVPHRNAKGTRLYTPRDIENLRILKFLLHDKGLRIEAAREELKVNRDGVIKRAEALASLRDVRDKLQSLLDSLHKLR
ncbi:MAG: MerR family transcriptional regulator [Muribaculaceae bacterium]|nr:MerR family transcriptional regulator [Muribaculaceae bacterium]